MQSLGVLLVDLNINTTITGIPNGLDSSAAQCTKLQRLSLAVRDDCAGHFLGLLLPYVGDALREFELDVSPIGEGALLARLFSDQEY